MPRLQKFHCVFLISTFCWAGAPASPAQQPDQADPEVVEFRDGETTRTVEGRTLMRDSSGGRLLQAEDGALWLIEAKNLLRTEPREATFRPLDAKQLGQKMLAELPAGFQAHETAHYVVCYNTSREYAEWTSSLLERLHRAFTAYWKRQGFELHAPEFPLPAIVYASQAEYVAASRDELGDSAGSVVGYYSMASNRVRMYDLTGAEAVLRARGVRVSRTDISRLLSTPAAAPLVATVVHEATHQIAFNCGLQQRFAQLPLWLVEGMATYFETPDLGAGRGWRGIGRVNTMRLGAFRYNLPRWSTERLTALLADDAPFRNARTASDAYADAWAINYYLIQRRPKEYAAYLREISQQAPLESSHAAQRVALFRKHFGEIDRTALAIAQLMSRLD